MGFNEFSKWHEDIENYTILNTFNASTEQKLTNYVIEISIICSWDFSECSKLQKNKKNMPFSTGQKVTINVIEIAVIILWF